nr:DNA-binding domain-containing protein [uncultured Glaciecola sp.]
MNKKDNQLTANQDYQRTLVAKIFNMQPRVSLESETAERMQVEIKTETNSKVNDQTDAQAITQTNTSNNIQTDTQTGLNIYTNNFIENGIRALSITFPTVEGLIGEDSFRVLSRQFLRYEAKASFDWAEYGITLPTFIESQEALETYPFLSEVAELDWSIHCVQREADKKFQPATFAALESGDTNALRFIAAPGLQIRNFWFPVVDLYRLIHDPYLQSEEGMVARKALLKNSTELINNAINMTTPRSLILWRAEYKAQFEYVPDAEADVIHKINAQSSVDAVIDTIGSHNIDLVEWLTKAISNKLIFAVA